MNIKQLRIVVFFVIFISCRTVSAAVGMEHQDIRKQISPLIVDVLIANGHCLNGRDCIKKNVFFISKTTEGVSLYFYTITSMGTVNDLLLVLSDTYEKYSQERTIEVKFHRNEFKPNSGFFHDFKQYLYIELKGTNYE